MDNRPAPDLVNQTISKATQPMRLGPNLFSQSLSLSKPRRVKTILRNKYRNIIPEPYAPNVQINTWQGRGAISGLVKLTVASKRQGKYSAHLIGETSTCAVDLCHYFHLAKDPNLSPPSWDFARMLRRQIVDQGYFHDCRISSECHIIGVLGKPLVNQ
jgi:hypothetical protein